MVLGNGQRWGWSSGIVLAFMTMVLVGLLLFYWSQRRPGPTLVELSLFRNRAMWLAWSSFSSSALERWRGCTPFRPSVRLCRVFCRSPPASCSCQRASSRPRPCRSSAGQPTFSAPNASHCRCIHISGQRVRGRGRRCGHILLVCGSRAALDPYRLGHRDTAADDDDALARTAGGSVAAWRRAC